LLNEQINALDGNQATHRNHRWNLCASNSWLEAIFNAWGNDVDVVAWQMELLNDLVL